MLIDTDFTGEPVDLPAFAPARRITQTGPDARIVTPAALAATAQPAGDADGLTLADRCLIGLLGTMMLCLVAGLGLSL